MSARGMTFAIVGRGVVACAAAALLKRALPACRVVLIEAGPDAIDVGAVGGVINELHRKIGIGPAMFQREAGAIAVERTDFVDWIATGTIVSVPENAKERFIDGIALHQLWLRDDIGDKPPIADLLKADAVATGWRFDAGRYEKMLRRLLQHVGVEIGAEIPDNPTLLVDCRSDLSAGDRVDWSPCLPSFALHHDADAPASHVDRVERAGSGLIWTSGAARYRLGDSETPSGRKSRAWEAGRISIGPAAVRLTPLYGIPLTVALMDLLRLIRLLPAGAQAEATRAEYNRLTALAHDAARDWACLPFALCDMAAPSPGLAAILAQFRHRARVSVREYDFISRGTWIAALIAMGVRPGRVDPTALVPPAERAARMLAAAS